LRWLLAVLLAILLVLQYRLWIAEGSLAELNRLEHQYDEQARINQELRQRNASLEKEVLELQTGTKGLEQRAREQLGLIREGETFYQFVDGRSIQSGGDAGSAGAAAAAPGKPANPPVAAPAGEEQP
jgi:cell division protein FtsB